jgi:hypothetical protein
MIRMGALLTAIALLAAASDGEAALADYNSQPLQVRPYTAYLTTSVVAPEHREVLASVIRSTLPAMSLKSYLPPQLPAKVPGTDLLRIDLLGLGWEHTWAKVIAQYYTPVYRPDLHATKQTPLVVSGLWVVAVLPDTNQGDGMYQLLYGAKPPKTLEEFEKLHSVNGDQYLHYAHMEDESRVSVAGKRVVLNKPVSNRGAYWLTLDSRKIAGATDQLENITVKALKHDASEALAGIPKHVEGKGGQAMTGFLADGTGKRQEKAPADIVKDANELRTVEIRNYISCRGCHVEGMQHLTRDGYERYIKSEARLGITDKYVQQEVDRYFQSPVAKEIERFNVDYAAYIELCNGLAPEADNANFCAMVKLYDQPLNLEQQAREIHATSGEQWRLALGYYSRTLKLSGRLSEASAGLPITRDMWIENYPLAQKVWALWKAH